jgi:hypothetical protein
MAEPSFGDVMNDYSKVPWLRIREYLYLLSSCTTRADFLHVASAEARTVIPFDVAAGTFLTSDARYLDGIGQGESVVVAYNTYYRTRQPYFVERNGEHRNSPLTLSVNRVNWLKFDYLEIATDFMIRNGMYKSLAIVDRDHKITVNLHRSRMSPGFADSDVDTLRIVNGFLNSLYSSFGKRTDILHPSLSAQEIAGKFRSLSRREAEVCSLVARRLNTVEMATLLFVSRRTIEKHIESVFFKLDVRSREQLRWRLGVRPLA